MPENPSSSELQRAASDPTTPLETLADLAYQHADLRPAIALNPSTYEGLLQWLGELGDSDVAAALAQRATGVAPISVPAAAPVVTETTATNAAPVASSAPALRVPRRLKPALLVAAAAIVTLGLVAGQAYAASSFVRTVGSVSAGGVSAAGIAASATDYRFGATKTWQTKVDVVDQASDGYAAAYVGVQTYPGLWLVSSPGEDSGSGRLASETLVALDPDTGAVKWSMSPGPYTCASSLVAGALACVDTSKATLALIDPSTGKANGSPLNGTPAESVSVFKGDLVLGFENIGGTDVVDSIQRTTLEGTVVWKKSGQCGYPTDDGMTFATTDGLDAAALAANKVGPDDAFLYGPCLTGVINLDTGTVTTDAPPEDESCMQSSPFEDEDGQYASSNACETKQYAMLVPRGATNLTALTMDQYLDSGSGGPVSTLWSATLADADLSGVDTQHAIAHLGAYALVASAGHLYGVDTAHGPSWEQPSEFSGDRNVLLLPIDASKANTPVLAVGGDHKTITRLDPGYGASRVSVEPASLPACPKGMTPVSFTTWDSATGATLVCQGFSQTVTVYLILKGTTYTSSNARVTPSGYYAQFPGSISVNIGLGGWAAWVTNGSTTTLHAASTGWQSGAAETTTFPALSQNVQSCPAGTYPLSLSTWKGGWLLTCGETTTKITRFVYVDGSQHGSGNAMTAQGSQSCGTSSSGITVCVSASPAVVGFTTKGGSQSQHSVSANYVVGQGFSGAGQGTGAYGLADPQATAASEVAYLNGILQQSQAARTSIKVVVQNILRCASTGDDVTNANAVVAARTTELQALSSAPVDAVPGGAALVSQLQAALQDSLTADQSYATAAGQVADGDCAGGTATFNSLTSLLDQGASEKSAFTDAWNNQIAAQYGTPTYTLDDI